MLDGSFCKKECKRPDVDIIVKRKIIFKKYKNYNFEFKITFCAI